MHAAVVHAFGEPPRYENFPDPEPTTGEVLVEVLAAGLHPLVRSRAAGTHYTSTEALPLIPGVDGVGRTADGAHVYFGGVHPPHGTMAERIALPAKAMIPLPESLDPASVAAIVNPAVSAWLAMHERVSLQSGEQVLVLGATGSAGRMAVQLARLHGAKTIIAAGRNRAALEELTHLGADHVICLEDSDDQVAAALAETAADVDVVVDYLWGHPMELALAAISDARSDDAHRLRWVHVGAMAGATITLQAATLRKTNVDILGSGLGSVPRNAIYAAVRDLVEVLPTAGLSADIVTVPLADVEKAWKMQVPSGTRIVLTT